MLSLYLLLAVSQVLGLVVLVLAGYWSGQTLGGFAWDGSFLEFNYHPLFMTIGFVFFYGDAILVFRLFRNNSSPRIKLIHFAFHCLALIFSSVGLKAVFTFHRVQSFPDMYSFHSWVGLSAVIAFCLQWVVGFAAFLVPRFTDELRKQYLPLHRYVGLATYAMVIAAALIGINEKLFFTFSGANGPPYSALPQGAYIGNFLGFFILLFGLVVGYIATNSDYRRRPPNSESDQEGIVDMTAMKTLDPTTS